MSKPQWRNQTTDVPGLRVGNAQDATVMTGVTVGVPGKGAVGAVDVRGGGPGTRDTEALGLGGTAFVLPPLVMIPPP